jgi:2-dehydropantoate 2-reductase
MKIAILGPGALGCLLAALFRQGGEDVTLVDYRPERVALLQQQGLDLETLEGAHLKVPVPIGLPAQVGPREVIIVTVKAHQTRAAARSLPQLMAGGGLALTLQNGLGNLEAMADAVGWERLVAGVALLGVTRQGEGRITYAGRGVIYLGSPSRSRVSPEEISGLVTRFRQAGLACQSREDIETALWEKLIINAGVNPLTALLRVPNGALLRLAGAWELAVAAAQEARQVARAAGVDIPGDPEELLRQVCTATAANRSSMLQDVLAGRPTEIEALNAQVVSRGAAYGIPTPVNHFLTRLLQGLQESFRLGLP